MRISPSFFDPDLGRSPGRRPSGQRWRAVIAAAVRVTEQVNQDGRAVFKEYTRDIGWHDPCQYLAKLPKRYCDEAVTLEGLTGWALTNIYKQMGFPADGLQGTTEEKKWYQKIWGK